MKTAPAVRLPARPAGGLGCWAVGLLGCWAVGFIVTTNIKKYPDSYRIGKQIFFRKLLLSGTNYYWFDGAKANVLHSTIKNKKAVQLFCICGVITCLTIIV